MSAHKVRPPLAKIQSTLEHSKAKGAELAKQAASARLEEEEAELAKREQARELMERRKAYGRATKRMGSPSPRRPLAGVQPSGFPSPPLFPSPEIVTPSLPACSSHVNVKCRTRSKSSLA